MLALFGTAVPKLVANVLAAWKALGYALLRIREEGSGMISWIVVLLGQKGPAATASCTGV